ncbi:MAG: hypothetical protein AAF901_07325, partial [Bacteroidota bacterium]
MQLYKPRGFSEFFQDTFAFLRQNGKHMFKYYFIINGLFLLILSVLAYFFTKFYSEILFGGLGSDNPSAIDDYISENTGIFILLFSVFLIVGLISALVSYAFIPIYLKLYAEKGRKNFFTSDIVNSYKENVGKLLVFLVCGILIGIPLLLLFGIIGFILAI